MELWAKEQIQTLPWSIAAMLLLAAVLRMTIGKRSLKVRMIPFQIVAVIAFAIEVGKQVVSLQRGYDLYHLPFHFCSLFIFMLPIMAFYRGRYQKAITGITSALCASVFLLLLIYPALIYSGANVRDYFTDYMSFHTVTFHNLVMFAFVLIIALELHTPDPKADIKPTIWFIIGFCAVSATMAQLLKTNYANYYQCNIPPLESLRVTIQGVLGYGLTQLLYICIVSLLNVAFVFLSYWICVHLHRILTSKKQATPA